MGIKVQMSIKKRILLLAAFLLIISINGCSQGHGKMIEFGDLVSNPQKSQGKNICTEGVYVSGFEVSALGSSTYQRGSAVYLTEPAIWIERPDITITSRSDCFSTETLTPFQFCRATVCGVFETGGNYGRLGAYRFQIRGVQ
jgi:hypothetical protein